MNPEIRSSSMSTPRELRNAEIRIRAYRIGGGGALEFTLPCGEKRKMTRTEADELVRRITAASR